VIEMRRVGHAGLTCAVAVCALLVALLVPVAANATASPPVGAFSVPVAAASARPVGAASTGTRFVSYNGVRVTVPATWPVIDLRLHPRACVRLDRTAVYLGSPGPQSDCPAHAVGRADSIWLSSVTAAGADAMTPRSAKVGALAARVGVDPIGHDTKAQFVASSVALEATWGKDSSAVDKVLASAAQSPAPSTPAPNGSPSVATTPSGKASTAAHSVSAAANPAIAAGSTFTGMAFDTCGAPSASTMSSWLASPYRGAGIYIGGSMRACGDGNLSSSWVSQVRSMGWGLLPIYVGVQAPCVNQPGLATISASQAVAQGTASADDAVSRAQFFGLSAGAPIYYDMEAYNSSAAGCSQTVMTFISAWTSELHRRGYKSGAYGSSSSLMVNMSASAGSSGFVAPDNVWFAHWNQLQTTSDSSSYPGFPDSYWSPHHRVHQYSGNMTPSWGGVSVNIDANWVDGDVAGAAVPVNYGTNIVGPGSSGFVFTGAMTYWRSMAPAGLKRLAYWTYSDGSVEANGATWSPQLAPGRYNVEANIPSTNATAKAPYTIRDAQGTTTKVVNQQTTKVHTSLGTYTAQAGSSISVHVGDNDPSSTTTQIGVDAMAFLPVTAAPTPAAPSPPGAVQAVGGNGQAVVSWSAAAANGSPVTGYTVAAHPGARTAVTTGATTATVTGLANGTTYTFTVTATNAVGSSVNSALSSPVAPAATSTRLAGADRYGTAVAISQYAFQPQYSGQSFAVTVASGANFPDALAAGPVASADVGPLLLVPQDGALSPAISTELTRLNPYIVHIAGGTAAVSSRVESELKVFGDGTVLRWAGPDRYGTAAKLAGLTGGLSKTIFIATGATFPDALGGSAAAGRLGGALMLTGSTTLPDATVAALKSGQPTKVVILGGATVIHPEVLTQVQNLVPNATVQRWAGADRYSTAAAISLGTYPQGATTAYLASGSDYPDALIGAPVAAHAGAPLLLTSQDCVPASTLAELTRLGATKIVVLGGTSAVSDAAANLKPCTS